MSNPESVYDAFPLVVPYYGRILPDKDDFVVRYREAPQFDHLQYFADLQLTLDTGDEIVLTRRRALFLHSGILDTLVSFGIPLALTDAPTPLIVQAYEQDLIAKLDADLGHSD